MSNDLFKFMLLSVIHERKFSIYDAECTEYDVRNLSENRENCIMVIATYVLRAEEKAIILGLYQMECTDRYPESDNQESDTDH